MNEYAMLHKVTFEKVDITGRRSYGAGKNMHL